MQRLTLKHVRQLIPLVSLPYFIGFEGVPYSGLLLMQIAEVNLRFTATTKMELFDQVTLCLVLERKIIVLVTEAKALYRV